MKSLKKLGLKTLAAFLSILMVVYMIPASAFAVFEETTDKDAGLYEEAYGNDKYHVNLGNETEPDALFEDDNLRESNVKYFLMDDGSYVAAVYPGAVHYLDENGKWQDIDNTLTLSGSEYSTGNARIKFAKKITGNESIFTLHDGNRKITASLVGAAKKTEGQVTNTAPESGDATQLQKLMTLSRLTSKILYADILDGVDLEYVLDGGNVKENIIVKERKDTYSYSFTLALNNLEAELIDNEVILKDGNETFYTIPEPYMYDAAGEYSDAAEYALTNNGNGKYILTVTADAEWMNDDDRAFPVTIDPPLIAEQELSVTFEHASVDSDYPNGCHSDVLYVGHREFEKQYRGFIKISGLDIFSEPAKITEVQLGYVQKSFIYHEQENTSSDMEALSVVIRPTYPWVENTLSWYNQSSIKSDKTAFNSANGTATGTRCYWQITDIVKDELLDNNNSVYLMMQTYNDYNGSGDYLWRSFYTNDNDSVLPTLTVKIRKDIGVENYWTTTDHSAGFAGSGYVNNRTGELTFGISTLSTIDSLMPTGFPLVYNTSYANYLINLYNSELPNVSAISGKGFKLGILESIAPYNVQNTWYYIYTDSDGTEHLFKPVNNLYEDMDGLGLTLSVNKPDSLYTVTDRAGYVYTYTILSNSSRGYLSGITTPDGNALIIEYGSTVVRPTEIKLKPNGQSAFVQLEIEYNTSGLVSRVFNPHTNEAYIFYYSTTYSGSSYSRNASGFLRKMVYVKGTDSTTASEWNSYLPTTTGGTITKIAEATYSYDSSGRLITARDELSAQEIRYTYDSYSRISTVAEYAGTGSSATQGQKIGFTYLTEATKVRSSGADDEYGSADDLYTNYVFDSRGRTVNAYVTDYSETVLYGASSAQYEDENEKAKNNVKFGIDTSGTYPNLLYNGAFEIKESSSTGTLPGWTKSGNVNHYTGNYAFDSGYAHIGSGATIYQDVTLEEGKYSFSFKATCGGNVTSLNVKVEKTSGGTVLLNESLTKDSMNSDSLSSNFSYIFEVTSGGSYRIKFTLSGGSDAIVNLDNVMLSKNSTASQMSYLEDGGFEKSSLGAWGSYSTVNSGSIFGSSAKIGYGTSYETIENKVFSVPEGVNYDYLPTTQSKVMTLYGWAKKSDVYKYDGTFRMRVDVKYNMGSSYTTETFSYDFCKDTTGWQYGSVSFEIQSGRRLAEISVILEYDCGYGGVYFDDIVLTSDESQLKAYEYNEKGLLAYSRSGYDQGWYYYNSNNDPVINVYTNVVSGEGSISAYEYNNKRQLTREAQYTFKGAYNEESKYITGTYFICSSFTNNTYNNYGLLTEALTFAPEINVSSISTGGYTVNSNLSGENLNFSSYTASSHDHISSKSTYKVDPGSPNFGAVTITEDNLGNQTRYFYNDNDDDGNDKDYRLRAVIYPDDTGLTYTYDEMGNVDSVLPAEYVSNVVSDVENSASVSYEYDEANRLDRITTESTVYTFEYDSFGNTTKISAGSNTLASYTYNTYNGKLSELEYGNGDSVRYTYDELDRISQIEYNNGTGYVTAVKYTYNADGNVSKMQDMLTGEVTQFSYDSSGRLTGSSKKSASGSGLYAEKRVNYDDKERLSSVRYTTGNSGSIWSLYTYDARDRLTGYQIMNGTFKAVEEISYDGFSRPTGRETTISFQSIEAFEVSQSYEYKADGKAQSALVSKFTSNFDGNTTIYSIAYDDMGNITSISDSAGVVQNRYEYDDLNQLVREDNRALGKSYTYTYDNAGNILSKKIYSFTLGTLGTPIDTISYTYNGDRLISYDGQSMTYDTIGNPTDYKGYDLTWENGRQLTVMHYIDDFVSYPKIEYTYNADGMITGVRHYYYNDYYYDSEYIVDGTRVLAYQGGDDRGSFYAEYLYDESGSPIGMRYYAYNFETNQRETECVYYFFEKNIFGDIVGVYDEEGDKVLGFTYDAWGNVSITESSEISGLYEGYGTYLKKACIFRYRGYMYESSSGFYYLQTRFYDSEIGRFINADGYINANGDLLGFNMYAYCGNNPINYLDVNGESIISIILLCSVIVTSAFVLKSDSTEISEEEKDKMLASEKYYDSIEDAVTDWGKINSIESINDNKERGAFIYSRFIDGQKYYYMGKTRIGFESTCWNAFIVGYMLNEGNMEGFVHTHTPYLRKDGTKNYNDYGPSNADLFLLKIPGVKKGYIANSLGEIYEYDEIGNIISIYP